MRVHITTFGCQMNKLDSELVMGELLAQGFEKSDSAEDADVVLYNTCSVRRHAEDKVYSHMGRLKFLKRERPEVVLGLIGCMAKSEGSRIFQRLPHLDLAVGPGEFSRLAELIKQASNSTHLTAIENGTFEYNRNITGPDTAFQAYLGIMRGCNNHCSYCVVPYTRGPEKSRPPIDIIDEAKRLVDAGVVEITLLGQNVNSYGRGIADKTGLPELLRELDGIDGLKRIRFVTNHPKDVSENLLKAMAECPTVCEYLHAPAQSGSHGVLDAMNRKYTPHDYRRLLDDARRIVPGIEISSDFIVGFPGESEEDFEETLNLVESADFLNTFVFKYSPRPRTKAAEMDDDVPMDIKRMRNQVLLDAQKTVSIRRQAAMHGKVVEVLVEGISKRDKSRMTGRTRQNQIVAFDADDGIKGRIVMVKITDSTALTLFGEIDGK